jgi:hypothetical protein
MSTPAVDQRINMSLEDMIKMKQQTSKQKREKKNANTKTGEKKKTGGLVVTKAGKTLGKGIRGTGAKITRVSAKGKATTGRRPKSAGAESSTSSAAKVAKSVGTSKANRNAAIAKARGLNTTGKATKKEIAKEVQKQNNRASRGNNKQSGGGLKISFKPKELNKTTDKVVSQQIKAVLSIQPTPSVSSNNSNNSKPRRAGNGKPVRVNH